MSSKFTVRRWRPSGLLTTVGFHNLLLKEDYGRLIYNYHEWVVKRRSNKEEGEGEEEEVIKGWCMTSYLVYKNRNQADKLLRELSKIWETTGEPTQTQTQLQTQTQTEVQTKVQTKTEVQTKVQVDNKSNNSLNYFKPFRYSSSAVRWLLDEKRYTSALFIRQQLSPKLWENWDKSLHLRLLKCQVFNNKLHDATTTFSFLASHHHYQNSVLLDKLLYRVRLNSHKLFLSLVRTGDGEGIPMAPGYVNSLIYQAALLTSKTNHPDSNLPKPFTPSPHFPSEYMLPIEEIFDWAATLHSKGYSIKEPTWSIILMRIIQLRGPQAGLGCLEYLKLNLPLNQIFYCIVIHGFIAQRNIPQAERLYLELTSQFEPNEVSLGTMLNGYVQIKSVQGAKLFLSSLPPDMPLNLITTTILINLAVKTAPSMQQAEELYQEFINHGEEPDLYLLGTMLHGYYYHRDLEGANQIIIEMGKYHLQPDLFALNMLISFGTLHLDTERALTAAQLILKSNLRPDIHTYNSLMTLFGAQGQHDRVENIFNSLTKRNFNPTLYSYNILLLTQSRSEQPLRAFDTYESLKRTKLVPSPLTFGILLTLVAQFQLFRHLPALQADMSFYQVDQSSFHIKSPVSGLRESLSLSASF